MAPEQTNLTQLCSSPGAASHLQRRQASMTTYLSYPSHRFVVGLVCLLLAFGQMLVASTCAVYLWLFSAAIESQEETPQRRAYLDIDALSYGQDSLKVESSVIKSLMYCTVLILISGWRNALYGSQHFAH